VFIKFSGLNGLVLFGFKVKQEGYYCWLDHLKREKRCVQITQQRNDERFIQAGVQKLICIPSIIRGTL